MKDLSIFEDYTSESSNKILDYNEAPIFQGFPFADNEDEKDRKDMDLPCVSGRQVLDVDKIKQPLVGERNAFDLCKWPKDPRY